MNRYDNDSRVVKVSDTEYRLSDGGRSWTVRFDGLRWHEVDESGRERKLASCTDELDADFAIYSVIGDSR